MNSMKVLCCSILSGVALLLALSGPSASQTVPPKTLEALSAALPDDATCRLTGCTYRLGGSPQRPGMIAFEGQIHNRSLSPLKVLIQVGFKESYHVRQGQDRWFVRNTLQTTLEAGQEGFPFRLSLVGPPEVNKSMRLGLLFPLAEIREAATGFLLDATVAAAAEQSRPIPEFDPLALAEEHVEKVGGYEIAWQTRLPSPDSGGPARFSGTIRNPGGKSETILLQAGFVNVLGRQSKDKSWSWKTEQELPIRATETEVPFELEVNCPPGIYVGIANKVYEGAAWLLTEKQREAIRRAEELAKQPRTVAPERILFDPQVKQVEIGDARYAYTLPGKPGNAGRFEFAVANRSEAAQALVIRFGFLSIQPPAPWNPRTWHFIGEKALDLQTGQQVKLGDEVRCHVAMENLIRSGKYDAFILVAPQETP